MMGPTEYFKSRATGRAVAGTVIFALLVVLVQQIVLVPHFQSVTGFKPFDVQFPLSRYAIAIQLGAYEDDAALAYLPFLVVDLVLAIASAAALILLWAWLFRQRRSRVLAFFERGLVILVPLYTLGCDIAENFAFARLIGGVSPETYISTVQFAATVHSVRGAFLDLQVILTVLFVILFGLAAGTQARPGAFRGETAINGG